jgi:hypothetical protein
MEACATAHYWALEISALGHTVRLVPPAYVKPLGAFYRRLSSRIGKQKAVTATARKIAVLFYNALRFGMTYDDPGAAAYEERHRTRVLANLRKRFLGRTFPVFA